MLLLLLLSLSSSPLLLLLLLSSLLLLLQCLCSLSSSYVSWSLRFQEKPLSGGLHIKFERKRVILKFKIFANCQNRKRMVNLFPIFVKVSVENYPSYCPCMFHTKIFELIFFQNNCSLILTTLKNCKTHYKLSNLEMKIII